MAVGAFSDVAFDTSAFSVDAFLFDDAGVTVPDVVGQTQANGTTAIQAVGLTVSAQTAYSSVVAAGLIISQDPVGGTSVAAGSAVTIVVSLGDQPVASQPSGGGGLIYDYEREMSRRRRERKRRQELEEESERIEEDTTREIARILREQEAQAARRAELQRLSQLVEAYAGRGTESALSERVQRAVDKAAQSQALYALYALERELQRAVEEEEFMILALRAFIEYEH